MNCKMMKDAELVLNLKSIAQKESELLSQGLEYLQEVELRKIHLARGYPSLFAFVTQELGYAEGSAHRRIEAMRLRKSIPEVCSLIESGALSLTVAAQTQGFIKQENKRRAKIKQEGLTLSAKREILESVKGLSSRACERKLVELLPEAVLPKEKICALKDQKTLIQFTADHELTQKLERIKELLSHKQLDNRYDALINAMADLALEKLEKKLKPKSPVKTDELNTPVEFEASAKTPAPEFSKVSRHIPMAVRRAVHQRDDGRCVHKDPVTGRVCSSRQFLQLDHIKPFAWGGENTVENLTLRCRNHNLYRAEQMGLDFIGGKRKKYAFPLN